jgi:ATP:cob(I)alamin adenosyltransferase
MTYKNITKGRGDKGSTDLCFGGEVSKVDDRIKCVGKIDSFNASIGLCKTLVIEDEFTVTFLTELQDRLFVVMGYLASADSFKKKYSEKFGSISKSDVENLDANLFKLSEEIGESKKGWAIYGESGEISARFDFSTTLCRECELEILMLDLNGFFISEEIKVFFNRLSKVLYLFARYWGEKA